MDIQLESIQVVGFAILLINIDDLFEFLLETFHVTYNTLRHLNPTQIQCLFTIMVIIVAVAFLTWEIQDIYSDRLR